MLIQGSQRFLLLGAGLLLLVIVGFLVRPTAVSKLYPTYSSTYPPPTTIDGDTKEHGLPLNPGEPVGNIGGFEDVPVLPPSEANPGTEPNSTVEAKPSVKPHYTSNTVQETTSDATPHAIPDVKVDHRPGTKPQAKPAPSGYVEVRSKMTPDGSYFPIDFGDYGSYNPNLVPHPYKNDTWVMIAQGLQSAGEASGPVYSIELVCDAVYSNGTMHCLRSPTTVPIASTVSDHCVDDLEWFNFFIGPNDPRVFMGPDKPYITYGSASQYTCLSQWIHDLRRLVRWGDVDALDRTQRFFWPTELRRPPPYGKVEKNWFVFWGGDDEMYIHYDIVPTRSFAKINHDGSDIGEDLAPLAAARDNVCLEQHLPKLQPKEHIHQATNSLSITFCKRSDSTCQKSHDNTYIFTIFHHKQYHGHNLYEPYIMLFKQTPPFEVYAISAKPFWITGRGKAGESWSSDPTIPKDQSQMMYVVSVSWKDQGSKYHGFLDDELMISFGIEDRASGAIDVVVGDLVSDLALCK